MLNTNRMINTPGGTHNQGLEVKIVMDCAPLSMLPKLAVGGCTPMPKKLNAASSKMDKATTDVAYTRIGAMVFGNISENNVCLVDIPATASALMNAVSRKLSTLPRTSLATPGQSTKPNIRMMFHSPG